MRVTPIIKLIVTAYISPQLHGTGSYIIEIPEEHIGELTEFMQSRNIRFQQRSDVMGSDPEKRNDNTLMGGDAEKLRQEVNRYLEQNQLSPLVPGPSDRWSIPTLQSFLDLAACNFRWSGGEIAGPILGSNDWSMVVRYTPEIFSEDAAPETPAGTPG